ncbi:MAG TPA: hypothetical protein DEP82_14500 [Arthrobacter bacterium]|nr:hypothetical protein [Arthrobacter sp.]
MRAVRFAEGVKQLLVPMDQVHQHLQNANNADLDALVESIQINGFVTAITADAKTGNIIAGNHRYQALHALGATEIPVLWVDHWDEAGAIRYMVADNQTSRLAVMDNAALAELLGTLAETETALAGTGFDQSGYERLLAEIATAHEDPDMAGFGHGDAGALGLFQVVIEFKDDEDARDQCFAQLSEDYANIRTANL